MLLRIWMMDLWLLHQISRQAMCSLATTIRSDLDKCVFFISEVKSHLDPNQVGEFLDILLTWRVASFQSHGRKCMAY